MDTAMPLTTMDPRPMTPMGSYPGQTSVPPIALHVPPESQIPDHPGSVIDVPRPSNGYMGMTQSAMQEKPRDVKALKSHCQFGLREYQSLQRKRQRVSMGNNSLANLDSQLSTQQSAVLADLRSLGEEVRGMVKAAENHRWRKWLIGGAIGSFIPLVRRIFRRGSDEDSVKASNDTEYAFQKSKSLLSRINEGLFGKGGLASVAFFVFAVLYVFQNEVTLRVAKTIQKRVRKLYARIERGDPDISDSDIKFLEGWRWRVLLW